MRRLHRGYSPRLLGYALATIFAGTACVAGAAAFAGATSVSDRSAVGICVFFLLALEFELQPVPIDVAGRPRSRTRPS